MCVFEFLSYYIIEDKSLFCPYELYHNGHIIASYEDINEAIDDIPYSEYI